MIRYRDATTDPILRKDVHLDEVEISAALLRLSAGWETDGDVATVRRAIDTLKSCLPESEPGPAPTRRREAV